MSDSYLQLHSPELTPIFQFAKDCFVRSIERFTGDIDEFNRNGHNDLFIAKRDLYNNTASVSYMYVWKTGVINKMIRDLEHKLTVPVHDIAILSTPAHEQYPWHFEGMEYTEHAPKNFGRVIRHLRRSVGLNYPVDNADLSKSKIEWATPSNKLTELLIDGYSDIMHGHGKISENNAQTDAHVKLHALADNSHHAGYLAFNESHAGTNIPGTANYIGPEEIADLVSITHDGGEGVRIMPGHNMVYDKHDELLTKVDEYYGMPVPTLIRTNQWHSIINIDTQEDRNMGSISFDPAYSYDDIKKLIMNNEFIK